MPRTPMEWKDLERFMEWDRWQRQLRRNDSARILKGLAGDLLYNQ